MADPADPKARELKMWLAVRTDLPLSVGKLVGQAMHAAGWLHLRVAAERPALLQEYLKDATPKIVVSVSSLAALERVEREAEAAGIPHQSVRDAGRSEIEPGTKTVCLFGPAYRDELPTYLQRLRALSNRQFTAGVAEASA